MRFCLTFAYCPCPKNSQLHLNQQWQMFQRYYENKWHWRCRPDCQHDDTWKQSFPFQQLFEDSEFQLGPQCFRRRIRWYPWNMKCSATDIWEAIPCGSILEVRQRHHRKWFDVLPWQPPWDFLAHQDHRLVLAYPRHQQDWETASPKTWACDPSSRWQQCWLLKGTQCSLPECGTRAVNCY